MSALVDQARTYLGVPYRHRGRSMSGLDCAGLPWCCYNDLGQSLPDLDRYGREPHRNGLMLAVQQALGAPIWSGGVIASAVERSLLHPGDVVVLRFVKEPHHLAIVGTDELYGLSLIHALGEAGRVVEHGLDEDWRKKICAVFRRPI